MTPWHLLNTTAFSLFALISLMSLITACKGRSRPGSPSNQSANTEGQVQFYILATWTMSLAALTSAPYYNQVATGAIERCLQLLSYSAANLTPMTSALMAFWVFEERNASNKFFWSVACVGVGLDGFDFYVSGFDNWPNTSTMIWIFEYLPQIIKIGFLLLALYAVIKSWRQDLITGRFKLRYAIVLFVFLIGFEMLFVENLWAIEHDLHYDPQYLHSLWLTVLAIALAVSFLQLGPIEWTLWRGTQTSRARSKDDAQRPAKLAELDNLFNTQEIYRDSTLNVNTLAAALQLPSYRLRQLINGELNYRNFNAFLNDYRIQAACRDLRDADKRNLPILTIALDVGFASLAPFNKAFRERQGMTPTEYRKRQPQA